MSEIEKEYKKLKKYIDEYIDTHLSTPNFTQIQSFIFSKKIKNKDELISIISNFTSFFDKFIFLEIKSISKKQSEFFNSTFIESIRFDTKAFFLLRTLHDFDIYIFKKDFLKINYQNVKYNPNTFLKYIINGFKIELDLREKLPSSITTPEGKIFIKF